MARLHRPCLQAGVVAGIAMAACGVLGMSGLLSASAFSTGALPPAPAPGAAAAQVRTTASTAISTCASATRSVTPLPAPASTAPAMPGPRKGDSGTRDGIGGAGSSTSAGSAVSDSSLRTLGGRASAGRPATLSSATSHKAASAIGMQRIAGGKRPAFGGAFEKEVVGTSQRFLRPSPGMGRTLERELNSERFGDALFQSLGLKMVAPALEPHRFVVALEQAPGGPLAYRLSLRTRRFSNAQMDSIFRLAMNYLQRRMEGHSPEFSLESTLVFGDPATGVAMSGAGMTAALLRHFPWLPTHRLRVVQQDARGEMVQYALVDGNLGWRYTVYQSQGRHVVEAEMRDAVEVSDAHRKLFEDAGAAARHNLLRQGIATTSRNWADFYAIELKTVLRVKYNIDWRSPADIAGLYATGN
ncbi:hypothetical protein DB346_19060 [Verrucomicrobia bacterium LW23]|nr:hypothetical protein DB346_19060 [Verrucomicrobia bacterium LW23]